MIRGLSLNFSPEEGEKESNQMMMCVLWQAATAGGRHHKEAEEAEEGDAGGGPQGTGTVFGWSGPLNQARHH